MEKDFLFELIIPSKILVSDSFHMVVVPGEEGDFGILKDHSNFISQIRPGLLQTYKNNKVDKEFVLYGGFAEATSEKLIVLSEEAYDKSQFNLKKEKEKISNLEDKIKKSKDEKEISYIQSKIQRIEKIIDILN